jgi:hypothetical protein
MLYKVGYEVERLVRFRIGPLRLEDLRPGEWRALTAAEVKALREGPKTLQAAPAPPSAAAARPARPAKPSRPRSAPARRPAFTGKRSAASAPRGARRP